MKYMCLKIWLYPSRHEDILGYVGIASGIVNFITRFERFMIQSTLSGEEVPSSSFQRKGLKEEKISCPCTFPYSQVFQSIV
jgi:hypothetical protein